MPPKKKKTIIGNNIQNFYEHPDAKEFLIDYPNPNFKLNQMKTPFMTAIVAGNGAGKTNMLINLLKRFDNTFIHIYICNQEEETLYDFLKKMIPKGLTITHKISDLPSFEELGKDKQKQKLFIFDDLVGTKNQDYIQTLYKRGRKVGCSSIYISQTYFDILPFIRKNLHYLFLLSIGGKNDLNLILRTYATGGIEPEELLEIYQDAVKQKLNFFKIDIRNQDINRKFSKNFTEFYNIESGQLEDANDSD